MKHILCFGDSNTWGLIPGSTERYPWGVRWTILLQEKLRNRDIRILEEGLPGRTTMFEDATRPGLNGLEALPAVLETHAPVDGAVLMLGTNDCKTYFGVSVGQIAEGLSRCVDVLLQHIPPENILIVSPILLGGNIGLSQFDPEFDCHSYIISTQLYPAFREVACKKGVSFLDAAEYAVPSETDREHMEPAGHRALADAIYTKLSQMPFLK